MNNDFKFKAIFDDAPICIWEEDGSESKKRIDALREQIGLEQIREYLDKNPEFVHDIASTVKVLDVNKKTLETYEANSIKDLKTNICDTFTDLSFDCYKDILVAMAYGNTFFKKETTAKTLKGKTINVILQITLPKKNEDYKKIHVSMVDISNIKEMEKEFKDRSIKNLKRFKDLIETTKTAYIVTSIDGIIKEVNHTFLEINSCKMDSVINKSIFEWVSDEDKEKLKRNLSLLEKGIAIEDLEICLTNKTDKKRGTWVRIDANVMENGEKSILCLIKDITTKKIEEMEKYINSQKQKDRVIQNISRIREKIQLIKK